MSSSPGGDIIRKPGRPRKQALKRTPSPPAVPIELLPHPKAWIFDREDAHVIFAQVLDMVRKGDFSEDNEEQRELIKQASLVSLWFFLKYVAGYNGPYNELTPHLHVDMANFFQLSMQPGSRAAAFLPRSFWKSTLFTHGGITWKLWRDPDLTIGLASGILDRAYEFMHIARDNFIDNEFLAWIDPTFIPQPGQRKLMTDKIMTLPNRTRRQVLPSIKVFAVGGSTQGIHTMDIHIDDPVGDDSLNSMRQATADMHRAANWFSSNQHTLLKKSSQGRLFFTATRYGLEDPPEKVIIPSIKEKFGYWDDIPEKYAKLNEDGRWLVYYRQAVEYGQPVFPENLDWSEINDIMRDKWNWLTQYMNNPYTIATAELSAYTPGEAKLDYVPSQMDYEITYDTLDAYTNRRIQRKWSLSDCDVITASDPAGTEAVDATARTSRSSTVVLATCPDGVRVFVRIHADYVTPSDMFEWMFAAYNAYKPRGSILETQGAFKILEPMLREEQARRGKWISLVPSSAKGMKKDVRIRNYLQPLLEQDLIRLTESARDVFMQELVGFPDSSLKDVLDACSLAVANSSIPDDPEMIAEEEEEREYAKTTVSRYTGY